MRGGGAIFVELRAGDALTISDAEGGQPCDLTVESAVADPLRLNGRYRVLAGQGDAGQTVILVAAAACRCGIHATGAAMRPDEQTPPTDLKVTIARGSAGASPPALLAAPKLDLTVPAATAAAYTVAAGDYIQIVDIDGQQCADFLAFDAAALVAGAEYGLDATTTRTLNGNAYPGPGLHAKFYDERMLPLVEVVRDTVGRHDTFGLACSAKSYDELGYPGHANCTDNFNAALARHNVRARKGWPAINFFFNTEAGPEGSITADESWSRPGDYVLLRALKDLVCATSSCADDIGTTNGWNPTDIQVRVYDRAETFSRGIVHRMTADAEPRLTRQSGFHAATAALTRNFTDYNGFWLPEDYTGQGAIAEYWACRERAALIDLSALRKFEITGPDAENLLALALTRDVRKLSVGQVVYTAMVYEHGGMIDDGTVMRLGPNNFRFVCGTDGSGLWLRELAARHSLRVFVRGATDQLHNVALQGPLSREILAPLIFTAPARPTIAELKWFRFTVGRLGGAEGIPLVISRTGYTGELGYEIWCHPNQAAAVWEALMRAGAPHGMLPMGLAALDLLRVEAGLVFAGHEFSDRTDPFEAGIGFTVAPREPPFIGQEALLRRRDNPREKLVGLTIAGAEMVHHGDPVHIGRAQVGVITSAIRSPILGHGIALARVDAFHANLGTAVEIGKLDGVQKRLAAEIVSFPHYDPQKARVRA